MNLRCLSKHPVHTSNTILILHCGRRVYVSRQYGAKDQRTIFFIVTSVRGFYVNTHTVITRDVKLALSGRLV